MAYKFVRIVPPFDIRKNFWENNFQISLIEPFKKAYDSDKSKDKWESSTFMWCLWLSEDPNYDNRIRRMAADQKRSAILTYNPKFDFNDAFTAECLLAYPEHCLTPAAKAFRVEENSLIRRAEFIDNAEYTFPEILKDPKGNILYAAGRPLQTPGTAKDIDSMRKLTLDIYKKYDQVRKMFEEEQNELKLFGGGKETPLEKGVLMVINDEQNENSERMETDSLGGETKKRRTKL